MTNQQARLCEDALYAVKELPRHIWQLEIEIGAICPKSPGSVLKMTGRPVAKTPFDTSETETFGILRATCRQAQELGAKLRLNNTLRQMVTELPDREQQFVRLAYGKELQKSSVIKRMDINTRQYYRLRERVLRATWNRIKNMGAELDLALELWEVG